jgi:hypothetical protein
MFLDKTGPVCDFIEPSRAIGQVEGDTDVIVIASGLPTAEPQRWCQPASPNGESRAMSTLIVCWHAVISRVRLNDRDASSLMRG